MIHLTGRVLPYTKLFATCNSNRQFIRLLEEKLSELGVESLSCYFFSLIIIIIAEPFTKASCIEWKRKHDEQAELTELMSNKLIQVDGVNGWFVLLFASSFIFRTRNKVENDTNNTKSSSQYVG